MTLRLTIRGLLLVPAIFVLQAACCLGEEGSAFKVMDYKFKAIKGTYSAIAGKVEFWDTTLELSSGESVASAYAGFSFEPEVTYLTMVNASGMAAHACSPEPNKPTQQLHCLRIRSNNDFVTSNTMIQAGMLLNEVFKDYDGRFSFVDGLVAGHVAADESRFVLILADPVAAAQSHEFSFEITLSDSTKLEWKSPPITITPN